MSSARSVLVAGCGFVGVEVARRLHRAGWNVTGLTHSAASADALADEPFPVVACDINDRAALAALADRRGGFEAVVDTVSSGRGGAEAYRRIYLEGARTLLETLHPQRFLFASSTSVYAQTGGELVDEESPAEPQRETGRILRETEELVLAHPGGQVARLGGLYAPERWVLWRKFCDGKAVIEGDGSRFINQIHRDDAASALAFLLTEAEGGIYNVTDGTWPTLREVYETFARATNRPLPPFGPINPDRKRGWTHKRVVTARLRGLGWEPQYKGIARAVTEARALLRQAGTRRF